MSLVKYYIVDKISSAKRSLSWVYRFLQADLGSNLKLNFPIKLEGKGKVKIGGKSSIESGVSIASGLGSSFEIGSNSVLKKSSEILVDSKKSIRTGDNFFLGNGSRLLVQSDWEIGTDVHIQTNCSIFSREPEGQGRLIISDGSRVGDYTIIDLVNDVFIEKDVAIGPNCTLYTHDHIYDDLDLPAWKGGVISKAVVLKTKCWVGSNVTILPGITVGEHSVVAAGSVVTKDVDPYTIVGGVPAKIISKIK